MCGISGIFSPGSSPSRARLESMNTCLEHRGPDEEGIFIDGPVGMAHRRLSVIDLETGRQPIFNEDGSVCVMFNGEIYNYRGLRESLSSAGHSFNTDTDTEVIVHLYEEHGSSFLEYLRGMFAFALWDSEQERLLLARDPVGIKPLLFTHDGDRLAFASELPALLESDFDHGGLDREAIAKYFGFGFIPAPWTAFSDVKKLRPGEMLTATSGGIRQTSFYTPTIEPRSPDIETAAEQIRTNVEQAVERRLQSDVPIGAFLSGGIDSSILVAALSRFHDEPVRTFTIGFNEERFDESWAAREVADYHNTDHTEFTVTPDDVRAAIPQVLDRLGEPFGDPSLIPTYVVARETSKQVKVAHSGDGADELFAGYDRYRGEFLSRYYRLLPAALRKFVVEPTVGVLPSERGTEFGELSRKAKKFIRGGIADRSDRHLEWMRIPDEDAAVTVRPDPVEIGRNELADQHAYVEEWLPPERHDSIAEMQAVEARYTLPNQMLRKVDTASMYNSLEVRVPFLDIDVIEYVLGLPTEHKLTVGKRKRVLKRAFDNDLPEAITKRDKQGFDMPVGEWFKDELADEFRNTVGELRTDVLDIEGVMSVYDKHVDGRCEHGKFLWTTYVFATWLRRMRREGILSESA